MASPSKTPESLPERASNNSVPPHKKTRHCANTRGVAVLNWGRG
ncbi:hypothetical protein AtDm6_2401 [Acetobacter tropicalis]|uniref:Uncharacterized protein n=1 Tax=Acetobacter tropicalis TaxID=104102 RepID=A0A094YK25_9PROT|nr:hypothetical protein AtDm6_2401 [Acetobacter tropicalis]